MVVFFYAEICHFSENYPCTKAFDSFHNRPVLVVPFRGGLLYCWLSSTTSSASSAGQVVNFAKSRLNVGLLKKTVTFVGQFAQPVYNRNTSDPRTEGGSCGVGEDKKDQGRGRW